MNTQFNRNNRTDLTAVRSLAGRFSRCLTAFTLALVMACATANSPVRAQASMAATASYHLYVRYDVNHVPSPSGTLTDITGSSTNDGDGHVVDFYGNVFVLQSDGSITDTSNTVVGYSVVQGDVDNIP